MESVEDFIARLGTLEEGDAAALATARTDTHRAVNPAVGLPLLAEKIHAPWPIDDLFVGVYAADSVPAARSAVAHLGAGESVITPDGIWLGPGWVQVNRDTSTGGGILLRTQELKSLAAEAESLEGDIGSASAAFDDARAALSTLEQRDASLRAQVSSEQEALATLRSQLTAGQARLEQTTQRLAQLSEELQDIEAQLADSRAELQGSTERLQQSRIRRESLESDRQALADAREPLYAALADKRSRQYTARDAAHAFEAKAAAIRSERAALEQSLSRNRNHMNRLQARRSELRESLQGFGEPFARLLAERETALAQRLQVEAELGQSRESVQQAEAALRSLEEQRLTIEHELLQRREELEKARLGARSLEIRLEGIAEQLAATGAVVAQVQETLPPEATEEQWEQRLVELARKIQRLGPINLAAIDEFTTLSERKSYLDRQHADLSEALATLQEAIRKIDRETRTRFKETFDRVNTGFQTLFPVLFGGGHAYLELTDEDLLETGVGVIARPPGKRNSTIHLLSGGEKALTAVALVFAIFELNPAPFCLLDEVDAPLDDANVVRFSDMLKQRARHIQFIFITHNKITMEIADQLVGVTMQEAGVSRLVSVNMDEAVRLAATA
jgi:chromosome segregation protein